ncbi:hypothetical protein IQ06DRAFT_95068 [Phaeosphaeriaceae sp. SRC1lsM3a]|nr:hypothetical protein IQ06DRAFT_95068 [Stagonospora sp. SRC1lsM3a]
MSLQVCQYITHESRHSDVKFLDTRQSPNHSPNHYIMAVLQHAKQHDKLHETHDTQRLETDMEGVFLQYKVFDEHRATLRLIRARLLLTHCSVLQNIICDIGIALRGENVGPHREQAYKWEVGNYYERMQDAATTAHKLATEEKIPKLIVRSEYWLGRSGAGNHEYRAAMEHFNTAKKLDNIDDPSAEGICFPQRHLLRNERADIDHLIPYCAVRMEKEDKLRKHAEKKAEKLEISVDLCMNGPSSSSPKAWEPDREIRVREAKRIKQEQQQSSVEASPSITWTEASHSARLDSRPLPLRNTGETDPAIKETMVVSAGRPPTAPGNNDKKDPQMMRRNSSRRRKPTLPHRNTRRSVRSVNTISSDQSSPRGFRLDVDLGNEWMDETSDFEVEEDEDHHVINRSNSM